MHRPVHDSMINGYYVTGEPEEEKPSPSGSNTGTIGSGLKLDDED